VDSRQIQESGCLEERKVNSVKDGIGTPLLAPTYPGPPYHYIDAKIFLALFNPPEEFLALFNPPEESLQALLPEPLRPSQMPLAGIMFGEQPCKEAGTFMEAGMLIQCLFDNPETKEEEVGVYFAYNYVDTDVAQAAGREIWGYPRKQADISLDWKGDTITGTAKRDGVTLLKATCTLDDEGEWIDSGPNINLKMIPSVTGKGYDMAILTAAYLTYDIKTGRSGEVEVEFQNGPQTDLRMISAKSK